MGIMVGIQDFESCETSGQFYGGNAGRKIGLVWRDGDWLVKFPGTTRNLQGSVPSYTTAPVSEWLGSHVYAALGIPVHETVLGIRDGRIVCACRDFTFPDSRLVNFHDLKNSLSDDEPGFTEDASTGFGVVLADVRSAIHRIPVLRSIDGVSDRFWDMFVVDAFIRNIDRNNTNWGVLRNPRGEFSLAPVYGNGNSFNNKRTESGIERRLANPDLIRQDALDVRSCYVTDRGKPIAPLKYLASGQDEECTKALDRFMERYDPRSFHDLLDSIPSMSHGLTVVPDVSTNTIAGSATIGTSTRSWRHGANCIQLWVSRPVRKHPSPSLFLIPIPPSYPHLLFRRVSTVRECDMSVSISMVKERGTDNRTIESVS